MSICLLILTVLWASKICVCDVVHSQDTHTLSHCLAYMYSTHTQKYNPCSIYTHTHKHTPFAECYAPNISIYISCYLFV